MFITCVKHQTDSIADCAQLCGGFLNFRCIGKCLLREKFTSTKAQLPFTISFVCMFVRELAVRAEL